MAPAFAFADNASEKGRENRKAGVNFCSKLSELESKTAEQIKNAEAKALKNQGERLDKITKRQGEVDEKRFKNRTEVDGKRLNKWGIK
jgi:hypothetical protein